jgi:hypothetical protein
VSEEFNPGYDPYNSLDRWPHGRDGRLIMLNTKAEVDFMFGPDELSASVAEAFFSMIQRPINASYLAIVDRGPDPECRIYSDAEIKTGKA